MPEVLIAEVFGLGVADPVPFLPSVFGVVVFDGFFPSAVLFGELIASGSFVPVGLEGSLSVPFLPAFPDLMSI